MRDESLHDCLAEAFLPAEYDATDEDVRQRRSTLLQAVDDWARAARPVCHSLVRTPVSTPGDRLPMVACLQTAIEHVSAL